MSEGIGLRKTYVVVELVPGECQGVSTVLSVEKAVVGVLVAGDTNGREVVVIDPNPGGLVDVDKVLSLGSTIQRSECDVSDHLECSLTGRT